MRSDLVAARAAPTVPQRLPLPALMLAALVVSGAAAAQEACDDFPFGVRFCPDPAGFAGDPPRQGTARYFSGDVGLRIEVAPLDVTADVDPARIRPMLNAYLAERKGLSDGLPVTARDRVAVDGRAGERVAYATPMTDGPGTVLDTVVLGDGFAVYVQTLEAGAQQTPLHRRLHDLALTQIDLPEAHP